jgi:hypothetical protein
MDGAMRRLALIAAAGIVLAGCGGSHTSSSPTTAQHYPVVSHWPALSFPKRPLPIRELPRFVSPTRLEIATVGSGSCPNVPIELVVDSPHAIRIGFAMGSRTPGGISTRRPTGCTLDLRPTRMLVAVDPTLIDVHHPVTVHGWRKTIAPLSG